VPPVIDPSAGASSARSADTATCPAGRYLPRRAGGRAVDSGPWRAPIAAVLLLLLLLLVVVLADSAGWPGRRCVAAAAALLRLQSSCRVVAFHGTSALVTSQRAIRQHCMGCSAVAADTCTY